MMAGILRHRITVQKPVTTRNSYGETIVAWTTVGVFWASVEPLSGREYFAAEHVQSEVTHRVRMRWQPRISPEMRILFDGRVFKIESVINYKERGTNLQLMCQEVSE